MLSKRVITVLAATMLTATVAQAQSVRQLGGPANLPPAGFTGQQFVDNKGCVFLKAGFGGQINWVPRVSATHRPLCGQPPTFGTAVVAAVEADMAPDPQAAAPVVAAPALTVAAVVPPVAAPRPPVVAAIAAPVVQAAAPTYTAPRRNLFAMLFGKPYPGDPIPLVPMTQPVAALPVMAPIAPVQVAQPTYTTAQNGAQAQCVPGSPVLETVLLRSGGTAVVCTRGDGTLTGWRSPLFPQGAIGAALTQGMMRGATLYSGTPAPVQTAAIPTPPKGYKLAWKDDRLNPMRGVGTASGQAQQDQVWTRDIPAVLVTTAPVAAAPRVALSTMSAPATEPATNGSYVQVGTFGQPANADGVRARLTALGLPVSTSQITRKGKLLQIVFAGPFGTTAQAQAALATARTNGFADAILK